MTSHHSSPLKTLLSLAMAALAGSLALTLASPAHAQDDGKVLNLYSARHYQTDEALYANFTQATGIKINRIDMDDAGVLARLKAEGSASPADVILLVDAARLWRAEVDGLFSPLKSTLLDAKIPAQMRGKDSGQGAQWFGFSSRARAIVYNKASVQPKDVDSYAKLAEPAMKGKLCTRSGSHPYNLSLFASLLEHYGEAKAESLMLGMKNNLARDPKGGDTDQIRAVATGECQVALTNSYYFARLMRSDKPEDKEVIAKVAWMYPDQAGFGTHLNIAGGAMARYAKNREAAVKFLEYLASDAAQAYFADGNNEWPTVKTAVIKNTALQALGPFKADEVPVAAIGLNTVKVQRLLDKIGYK
jgi:iron(III) transport system substrate-binding protein